MSYTKYRNSKKLFFCYLYMQIDRVDQTDSDPINPLDLDLRSDYHWYTPVTISKNEWNFLNPEINEAPTSQDIDITREEWENFLDGFSTDKQIQEESWSEDQMDTIVDEDQFYYNIEKYGYTPDTYENSMNAFLEEIENDEFERLFPTEISYEDIHDLLDDIDNGNEDDLLPRWLASQED